jgi:phage gp29-like protein
VLADFILIGHQAVGSFALASSKTELFAVAIGGWLTSIADVLNRHAVPRLLALNPEFAKAKMPTFAHDDIETPDLEGLGNYIAALSGAGMTLFPDEELEDFVRRAAGMPERAEGDGSEVEPDDDTEPGDDEPDDAPPDAERAVLMHKARRASARKVLSRLRQRTRRQG